jgi:hypothetical protein
VENSRAEDVWVNITKEKKLTNIRAAGTDEALRLIPLRQFSLEQAMEYITEQLFDKGATVVGKPPDSEFEAGVSSHLKCFSIPDGSPFNRPGQQYIEIARKDFHDLFFRGIEFIFAGKHNTERFFGTVRKYDAPAGDISIKIDIAFFNNRHILEFRHRLLLSTL